VDWDADGLPDVVFNSIWGRVEWLRNVGTRIRPRLAVPANIDVQWLGDPPKPAWTWWKPTGKQLVTQWRTTPVVHDFDGDGLYQPPKLLARPAPDLRSLPIFRSWRSRPVLLHRLLASSILRSIRA